MSTTIKSRRGTTALLTANDPTPARGEIVVEYDAAVTLDADVVSVRIGDGERPWSELSPIGGGGSMTAAEILAALITVDGAGTGLDADLLDGLSSAAFATAAQGATADAAAPAAATTAALALKAPLASPALTGTPTVPTAAPGTDTTQAASTAFVQAATGTSGSVERVSIDIAFDTPNLEDGVDLCDLAVGDVLLALWLYTPEDWDGTTPALDFGPFVGNDGIGGNWSSVIDMSPESGPLFEGLQMVATGSLGSDLVESSFPSMTLPVVAESAVTIKVVVSQDGLKGGDPVGGTAGASTVHCLVHRNA